MTGDSESPVNVSTREQGEGKLEPQLDGTLVSVQSEPQRDLPPSDDLSLGQRDTVSAPEPGETLREEQFTFTLVSMDGVM